MKIDGKQLAGKYSDPSQFHEIVLQDGEDFSEVQLMRTGKFKHPFMEDFEVTEDMFKSFKKNFDKNVKKLKLAFDYSHFSGEKAAGWFTKVTLKENNTELWVTIEWTPKGRQRILDKEFRYTSADFTTNYIDNETGKEFGPTLNGAGLTNRPFIKDMDVILSEIDLSDEKRNAILEIINDEPEKKESKTMDPKEIKEYIATLSDDEKKEMGLIEEKEVQLSDDESKAALEKSQAENRKLSDDLTKEKKDREFSVMLSEGKAVPKQKEAFMSGDMAEFVKLAVPVNLKGAGSGSDTPKDKDDEIKTFDDAADRVDALVTEKMEKNTDLTFSQASKIVLSENSDLEKIMETSLIA